MNLNYIHKNDIDEKYVLGQLNDEEKLDYEGFLKENEQARLELQKTRNLIEGIRNAGSDSMRKEIERQVDEIRSPRIDWSLLYKAAAVLFVFVLVPSVVYFQFYDIPENISEPESSFTAISEEKDDLKDEMNLDEEMRSEPIAEVIIEKEKAPPVQRSKVAQKKSIPAEKKSGYSAESLKPSAVSKNEIDVLSDLDDAMSLAGRASSASGSMESAAGMAKQSSPPTSINKNVLSKMHSFNQDKKRIQLIFYISNSLKSFPDSLPVVVLIKEDLVISLNCAVSYDIYNLEKKEIAVEWNKKNKLNITLLNNYFYSISLDSTKTKAYLND